MFKYNMYLYKKINKEKEPGPFLELIKEYIQEINFENKAIKFNFSYLDIKHLIYLLKIKGKKSLTIDKILLLANNNIYLNEIIDKENIKKSKDFFKLINEYIKNLNYTKVYFNQKEDKEDETVINLIGQGREIYYLIKPLKKNIKLNTKELIEKLNEKLKKIFGENIIDSFKKNEDYFKYNKETKTYKLITSFIGVNAEKEIVEKINEIDKNLIKNLINRELINNLLFDNGDIDLKLNETYKFSLILDSGYYFNQI